MKRNLLVALSTLPFHLYVWFTFAHLSMNTIPFGRMELNALCASAISIVLVLFLILTLGVLLPSSRPLAVCLAIAIVVSHYFISANIYRIRNVASQYIEEAAGAPKQK